MVKGAVKSAAPPAPSSSTPTATPQQRLPQMGTGLNVAGNPVDNIENIPHVSDPSLALVSFNDGGLMRRVSEASIRLRACRVSITCTTRTL